MAEAAGGGSGARVHLEELSSSGVRRLWLDRPDKANALDPALVEALAAALAAVAADPARPEAAHCRLSQCALTAAAPAPARRDSSSLPAGRYPDDGSLPETRHPLKRLRSLIAVCSLALAAGGVSAQTPEDNLRKALEARMPGEKVREIRKTPLPGIFEVAFGNRLFYTDEGLNYLIIGNIIEAATNRNLTDLRLRQLTAIDVRQLPLDAAIRSVRGDGQRTLYVFSDPLCPFCSQLEQELQKVTNVTIYTFLTPVEQMRPGSRVRALEIWCSTDRVRAWEDWMLKQVAPRSKPTCRNPVDQVVKLSDRLGFQVTPTLVFADGAVLSGMVPAAQIEKFMNAVAPAAPARK